MSEPRVLRCTVCGLKYEDHSEQSLVECQACGNNYLAADGVFLSQKTQKEIDTLKNLRIRLSEVVEINDYNMIYTHAEDILKILPDDFLAQYFYAYSAYQLHQPKLLYDFFKQEKLHGSDDHIHQVINHLAKNADIKEYDNILNFVKLHVEGLYKETKEKLSSRINLEDSYAIVNRDIFICHRSTEESIVIELAQKLEGDGYTCWYSERNLRPDDNENYWKNIEDAIDHCEVFLVVSSQSAMLSKDVQREMQYANKKSKKKLEYKVDESVHTTLFKHTFNGIKWIDAIKKPQFEQLKQRVYLEMHQNQAVGMEFKQESIKTGNPELVDLTKKLQVELRTSKFNSAKKLVEDLKAINFEYEFAWLAEILIEFKMFSIEDFLEKLEKGKLRRKGSILRYNSVRNYFRLFPQSKTSQIIEKTIKIRKQKIYRKKLISSFVMLAILLIASLAAFSYYQNYNQPVTFDLNGNDVEFNYDGLNNGYNNELSEKALPIPERPGYQFLGWYTTPNFSGNVVTSITPGFNSSHRFYARWSALEYTISFISEGGIIVQPIVGEYNERINSPETPSREGYTFERD